MFIIYKQVYNKLFNLNKETAYYHSQMRYRHETWLILSLKCVQSSDQDEYSYLLLMYISILIHGTDSTISVPSTIFVDVLIIFPDNDLLNCKRRATIFLDVKKICDINPRKTNRLTLETAV